MRRDPDENGRYALSTREYEALRTLFGALNSLNTQALTERIALIDGAAEKLETARKLMQDVNAGLLGTIPLTKLQSIRHELNQTVCEIRLKSPVPSKGGTNVYVDQGALTRVLDRAIQMNCLLCSKSVGEGRRCQLFKDLNACFPFELDDPDDVLCPFAGISSIKLGG